jgi:outer membrane protein OmpA-like peptidoglycan-associated protein
VEVKIDPRKRGAGKTVLVVDDSALMRKAIESAFLSDGFKTCVEAKNGKEGIEAARKCQPDLIILDWSMTVMNGLEAAPMNVHFATGKSEITSDSESSLSDAVTALKAHPDWNIRVEGFTDNVGSPEANVKLSSDRANAVMNWLADHGIDRSRLSAKGYGESHAVAKNSTAEGRAKNRRVQLVRL